MRAAARRRTTTTRPLPAARSRPTVPPRWKKSSARSASPSWKQTRARPSPITRPAPAPASRPSPRAAAISSRALKDDEKASGLKETTLALDGIAIIVNPQNPVKDLTLEQIAKIYTGEITNWKDVGGNDAEIVLIGREAGSGTRDGFESITGSKDACQYRQELTSTGDVITTVSQNPNAIGYASLAAIKDSVKALTVNGVAPTEATVKDGTYLVQRPFVLVTKEGVALSETAQKFFDFATSADAASIISAAGAVPVA